MAKIRARSHEAAFNLHLNETVHTSRNFYGEKFTGATAASFLHTKRDFVAAENFSLRFKLVVHTF